MLCRDKIKGREFPDFKCILIIPLNHQHAISPHNIATESYVKVIRIKKLITKLRSLFVNKFSFSVPKEM